MPLPYQAVFHFKFEEVPFSTVQQILPFHLRLIVDYILAGEDKQHTNQPTDQASG